MRQTLLISGAIAGLAFSSPALAEQPDGLSLEDVILQCAEIQTADARLECFEAVAGTLRAAKAPSQTAAAAETPPGAAPADDASATEQNLAAAKDASSATRRFIIVDTQSKEGKRAQRDKKLSKGESFTAKIAAAKRNNTGRLFIQLDDGQIWREIEGSGSDVPMPRKGADVTFEKAMFKSWWVYFKGNEKQRVKMVPFTID